MVVVVGDGPVESLLLPLHDVFEGQGCIPGSIRHEAILVGESPDLLVINVPAGEAQVGEGLGGGTIGTEVGVDAWGASLVRTVEFGDGVPNFPLYFEVILEVVDDCVVLVDISFVVVLVEFGCDVVGRARVLVGQGGVGAIVEEGVFLYEPEVGFFFVEVKDAQSVVFVGAETPHDRGNLASQHHQQYNYYPSIQSLITRPFNMQT